MQRTIPYSLVAMSLCLIPSGLCAQPALHNQNEAIDALERAFLPANSVRTKLQSVGYQKGGIHQKETRVASLEAEILRDGARWWVKGKRTAVRFNLQEPKEHKGTFEFLVDNEHLANVTWIADEKTKTPHSFSATFKAEALRDEPGVVSLSSAFVLFGFSPNHGIKQLVPVLREANEAGRLKVFSRGAETVLEVRDKFGLLSIVLQPTSTRLLPVNVDIVKGPSDMLSGKKVGEWSGEGISNNSAEKMLAFEQHIGPITWDSNQRFIKSFEVQDVMKYPGGNVEVRTVLTALNSHTPTEKERSQFVITSAIPNGTPVSIREMRQIAHEWRDGKIQKVVDMSAAERMDDTRFEQPAAPLFTLSRIIVALSITVGIISVVWLVYRRVRAG